MFHDFSITLYFVLLCSASLISNSHSPIYLLCSPLITPSDLPSTPRLTGDLAPGEPPGSLPDVVGRRAARLAGLRTRRPAAAGRLRRAQLRYLLRAQRSGAGERMPGLAGLGRDLFHGARGGYVYRGDGSS